MHSVPGCSASRYYISQLQYPPSLRRQACLQICVAACLLASANPAYALSLEASSSWPAPVPPALPPAADEQAQLQEGAPQREAYEQAELHIRVTRSTGSVSTEELAASLLEQVQDALGKLLTKDPHMCGKKSTYMKFGCKGDWPNLEQVAEFAEQANKANSKQK